MDVLETVDLESLKVLHYPAPVLREPAREVAAFDARLAALARRMFEIMYEAQGVGLAAPQVGVPLRVFVANPTGAPGGPETVYVNPAIVSRDDSAVTEEACLSVPGLHTRIKRARKVTIRAQDLQGRPFEQTGEDLLARIFQHETDHLDGTTIADRMSPLARLAHRRLLEDLARQQGESPDR